MKLLTRTAWAAKDPNRSYVSIPWHEREGVEYHHSVGIYRASNAREFALRLQRDHLGRNWTDVFYNTGIWYDGTVIVLRPWWAKSGAITAFTIVLPGDYGSINMTGAQKTAAVKLHDHVKEQGVGNALLWHRLRANVACPGDNVVNWLTGSASMLTPEEEQFVKDLKRHTDNEDSSPAWAREAIRLIRRHRDGTAHSGDVPDHRHEPGRVRR